MEVTFDFHKPLAPNPMSVGRSVVGRSVMGPLGSPPPAQIPALSIILFFRMEIRECECKNNIKYNWAPPAPARFRKGADPHPKITRRSPKRSLKAKTLVAYLRDWPDPSGEEYRAVLMPRGTPGT